MTHQHATDAIDELVRRAQCHSQLEAFHTYHRAHPELLDFLVQEIRLRLARGFRAFSFHSLWEYARWKLEMDRGPGATFQMNDHAAPFYARAITILHPEEFNVRFEARRSLADRVFGVRLEEIPKRRPKNYARRLVWADGTALELGWRPSRPHVVRYAPATRPHVHARAIDCEVA